MGGRAKPFLFLLNKKVNPERRFAPPPSTVGLGAAERVKIQAQATI